MRAKTNGPLATAISAPPANGPASAPAVPPTVSVEFARASSPSGARAGRAALEAGTSGAATSAATTLSPTSAAGAETSAIATKQSAPSRSEQTITARRSWRSAIVPASGLANAGVAKEANATAATQVADPVRA